MIVGGGLKLSLNHLVPPALGSVLKSVCVRVRLCLCLVRVVVRVWVCAGSCVCVVVPWLVPGRHAYP